LIEVNSTPSLATGTPLDAKIKKNLVSDSLRLVNVSLENKEKWNVRERFMKIQKGLHGIGWKLSDEEKVMIRGKLSAKRTEWENRNMGGFRRVYPADGADEYEKLFKAAEEILVKYTGIKNRRLTKLASNGNEGKSKKSNSCSKLSNSNVDLSDVISRLSQPRLRTFKSKIAPKVIYHYVGDSNILKMSPSSVHKIELHKKVCPSFVRLVEPRKAMRFLPKDVKVVLKKKNS